MSDVSEQTAEARADFKEKTPGWRLFIESGLSKQAKVIYTVLWLRWNPYRKQCNPSFISLSNDTGIKEDDIGKHIEILEKEGWLKVTRSKRLSKIRNQYQLLNGEGLPLPKKWMLFIPQKGSETITPQKGDMSPPKRLVKESPSKEGGKEKSRGGAHHAPDSAAQSGSGAAQISDEAVNNYIEG